MPDRSLYIDSPTENSEGPNVKEMFKNEVRKHFINKLKRPELLNRIGDNIVAFNFIMDNKFLIQIARTKLGPLKEFLKEKGIFSLIHDSMLSVCWSNSNDE